MQSTSSQPDTTMQARRSGLVIAAIGLQLLLCSVATAANAAGDSIDRSARRIPTQVAQAFRDIVDRSATVHHVRAAKAAPGYRLSECPQSPEPSTTLDTPAVCHEAWAKCLLNLPPPAMCEPAV